MLLLITKDLQVSGPQFIYWVMHSLMLLPPHSSENAYWGYFYFFRHFLEIYMLSILIATVDMRKRILPAVTCIRVTRHSIFQPHRYVGADIT